MFKQLYDNTQADFYRVYRKHQWPHSYLIGALSGVKKTKRRAFGYLDDCFDALSAWDVNGQVCHDCICVNA